MPSQSFQRTDMAQTQYRINLSAKDFTFLAEQWGRTIIVKQFDQNFSRQIVSPTDPDKDIGIPQIWYCHNVMPSSGGFQSVGFPKQVNAITGIANPFYRILRYVSSTGTQGYLGFVVNGSGFDVYFLPLGDNTWNFVGNVSCSIPPATAQITAANVNGKLYFLIPKTACYTYDPSTNTLTAVTLTGLDITTIIGITDSFGYMIAWSTDSIAWSSTIDPTDFTPSLTTGAGGGSVQGLKGTITQCFHHVYGFIVYSPNNAVSAVYSGNSRYPFNFKEVIGAGGLADPTMIGTDGESGNQYAWTTSGLQLLSINQAVNVFPEAVNFIGGSRFEDFNESTNQFVETEVVLGSMSKKLTVIANRYLVISYGVTALTHAIVYDIAMKRWGKIKIPHVICFEYVHNDPDQAARSSLAFVNTIGEIYLVDFSQNQSSGAGVIILGKYQHTRNRLLTLQQVAPEVIANPSKCTVWALPTLDGKNYIPQQLTQNQASQNTNMPIYDCRVTGLNISLLFKGSFVLSCCVLAYIPNGRR